MTNTGIIFCKLLQNPPIKDTLLVKKHLLICQTEISLQMRRLILFLSFNYRILIIWWNRKI